jgi:hypothetical protein
MLALSVLPVCAVGQKTADEIKARLVGKALYLRGQWSKDKLEFDADGHLQKAVPTTSFTLSGVEITTVKLSSKGLELDGQRLGLVFAKDARSWVRLKVRTDGANTAPELIDIRIKPPSDGDFSPALNAIFASSIEALDPPLQFCWQQYANKNLLPQKPDGAQTPDRAAMKLPKIGGGVSAPKLLKGGEPEFSEAARAMKFSAIVVVSLVVGTDGIPAKVWVLHPAGLGLDELAVQSVSRYKFSPAMLGDKPVPVMLNVEVNFQIF